MRVTPGPLDAEAYGIKSNAQDLIRYLEANMQVAKVGDKWRKALAATHTGYFHARGLYSGSDVGKLYLSEVALPKLTEGNNAGMNHERHAGHCHHAAATALNWPPGSIKPAQPAGFPPTRYLFRRKKLRW